MLGISYGHARDRIERLRWYGSLKNNQVLKFIATDILRPLGIGVLIFVCINAAMYVAMSWVTLPFTRVGGIKAGSQTRSAAVANVGRWINNRQASIKISGQLKEFTYEELGISFDGEATFDKMQNVRGFMTLPLVQMMTNNVVDAIPKYHIDFTKLTSVMSEHVRPKQVDSRPASLYVDGHGHEQQVVIKKERVGKVLSAETAAQQVIDSLAATGKIPDKFKIKPQKIFPAVSAYDLKDDKRAAELLLKKKITVKDETGKISLKLSPAALARLISNDGDELGLNQKALKQYLSEDLWHYFFRAPQAKRVDGGRVTARGKNGSELAVKPAMKIFSRDILAGKTTVVLPSKNMKAPLVKNGRYPHTDAGLYALMSDFDNERAGSYRILVQELKNGGLHASHNGLMPTIPASIYKIVVAYAIMNAVENGKLSLSDPTPFGTIEACMYEMIHVSTDHCARYFQDLIGWQRIDNIMRDLGMTDTVTNNQNFQTDKTTTALDQFRFLRLLHDGNLMKKKHNKHLLDLMKNQQYRNGIPAGSPGAVVANKVGFFVAFENDIGIVYAPFGDYVIIALSDGGSFWETSDLALRVNQLLKKN